MKLDTNAEAKLELDLAKLLGFRNVVVVTTPDSDVVECADLAFTKRGRESFA